MAEQHVFPEGDGTPPTNHPRHDPTTGKVRPEPRWAPDGRWPDGAAIDEARGSRIRDVPPGITPGAQQVPAFPTRYATHDEFDPDAVVYHTRRDAGAFRKRRRQWPWLVLLAVLAIVAVGIFASQNAKEEPKKVDPLNGSAAVALNVPVTDGQFQMTIKKVAYQATPLQDRDKVMNLKPRGQWAIVTIAIKNTGKTAQAFYPDAQRAYDKDGNEYQIDGSNTLVHATQSGDKSNIWYEQINPGQSGQGVVLIDIPKGVKLTSMIVKENPGSDGKVMRLS